MINFDTDFEDIDIQIKGVRLPKVKIPQHWLDKFGFNSETTNEVFLKAIIREGLVKLGVEKDPEYIKRIKKEYDLITDVGFTDYMLLVWEVINFCTEKNIPVGLGRGSAASSLLLYSIGVTGIDPIENDLIFERFLSRARAKSYEYDGIKYIDGSLAPDVDLDICTERRHEVVEYMQEKYAGAFCKIPTISRLATKQAVKDVSKIFGGFKDDEATVVSKSIPTRFGQPLPIDEAMAESEPFKEFCDNNPEIVTGVRLLKGMIRQKGSHASAYLIGFYKFEDYLPCELDSHGDVTCCYDMNYAQQETIKLDLLGLHGVTLIDRIQTSIGPEMEKFDPNDPWIYKVSQGAALPYGLFQIGADSNYKVFRQVQPKNWSELSDVISLARPGAMSFVGDYISNEYKDYCGNEAMKKILAPTHNIPIYQEAVLQISEKVFGFSLEDGEMLRRAISKKKPEEIAKWNTKIEEQRKDKGIPKELGDFFMEVLEMNGNYGFAKAHAAPYSRLSAYTLFLKYKYPQHFYCESLKMAQNKSDSQDHISKIQSELHHFGIKLLPPDFIKSEEDFKIEGNDIRFGFSCIKGVSEKSLTPLKNFLRSEKSNKFEIFNAAEQCKLNVGIVCALIQAGMMNEKGTTREKLVFEAQLWKLLTNKEKTYCLATGESYDFDITTMVKNIDSWVGENGKKVARSTRLNTIKKKCVRYKEIYAQNREHPTFASWVYERKLLGYSYTTSLKAVFSPNAKNIKTIDEVKNLPKGSNFEGVFEVIEKKKAISGKGNKYIRLQLGDESGQSTSMLLGDRYEAFAQSGEVDPKEGEVVYILGSKDEDVFWINSLKTQDKKVFMKLADLR